MFCPNAANGLKHTIQPSDLEHLSPFPLLEFTVITVENGTWFQVTFVIHVAYITLIMRLSSNKAWSQLNDKLLHVLASPSRDGKNNSSYKPFNKHTKLCIHRVLNARATILFLSGADCSLFAWLLVWGWTQKWSCRRISVWILTYWQHIHLLLVFWRASKHLLQLWMRRQVRRWSETSLICVERDLATRLPIGTLQRQKDLKLNDNMIIQGWINLRPLGTH